MKKTPRTRSMPQLVTFALATTLIGCAAKQTPIEPVPYVDLERFMGDWYVIANIPTFLEKEAYNAVETYELNGDGTIDTTFVFRKGGFDGPRKEHNPKGFILDSDSNSLWGMQFIWPIKADYRIAYLDEDYTQTVIARNKRDFVWIMARDPEIPNADYESIKEFIGDLGYDTSKIRRVPQKW